MLFDTILKNKTRSWPSVQILGIRQFYWQVVYLGHCRLLLVRYVLLRTFKPLKRWSSYSDCFQFGDNNFVIDNIKDFSQINKNSKTFITVVNISVNSIYVTKLDRSWDIYHLQSHTDFYYKN